MRDINKQRFLISINFSTKGENKVNKLEPVEKDIIQASVELNVNKGVD